jgi:membrane-anchored protein YejM (alkaline phosphatase superfamily)
MKHQVRARILNHFFFAVYLTVLFLSSRYWPNGGYSQNLVNVFALAVYLTYGFIYVLPAMLLTKLMHWIARLACNESKSSRVTVISYVTAIFSSGLTLLLLFADIQIYKIYDFHINGFVINLVSTPGGIESMGMSDSGTMVFGLLISSLFAGAATVLWLTHFLTLRRTDRPLLWKYRYLIIVFALLSASERVAYGVSSFSGFTPVLVAADRFPLYQPFTAKSFAKKLGLKPITEEARLISTKVSRIQYPVSPLKVTPPERPLNVVWMVSESLRADMLDPEIMPATWNFSEKSHRFTHHYSGSNSTRMGVFSMFYGLYGNFWFPFLDSMRGPVLFDVLQEQNYQRRIFSSQKLSYPEFDRTVFAAIPKEEMQSYTNGSGWERDRKNVSDLLDFLRNRDPARPFISYMFFESPHARYYFPEESVIRTPYLDDFNYATMDLQKDMPLIKNRYINSVHHLDSQFARVLEYLEQEQLLENTIVIITGDHGEEFNDHGYWGHGSSFNDAQTKVPMVIWVPGTGSSKVEHLTSHLDIIPTLLPRLGVQNPVSDYALGYDMLGPAQRTYTVTGHWRTMGFISENYKAVIAMDNAHIGENTVTDAEDNPVSDPGDFYKRHQADLVQIMRDIAHFSKK